MTTVPLSFEKASQLVEKHGSPLLVIQKKQLVKRYQTIQSLLPRVQLHYAMKANPHPEILDTFNQLGGAFEVASQQEIELLLAKGIEPNRIIFANTVKTTESLELASKNGVEITTFDCVGELDKIAKYHPRSKVLLRIKVPNVNSVVDLSYKFGVDANSAADLFLQANKLGLTPLGVCFHVGSQCLNTVNYGIALELAAGVFKSCKDVGINLSLLDIGGGFPIQYLPETSIPTIKDICRKINHGLDKHFSDKRIKVVAEPGRILCAEAVQLLCKIIGYAVRDGKQWYTLDDGIYGSYSGLMFDHANYQYITYNSGDLLPTVLAGPSCDSLDVIADDLYMPQQVVGDLVVTPDIGAYSSAHATQFNGFPLTKVIVE